MMKAVFALVVASIAACSAIAASPRPKAPVGTFIQWYLVRDWDDTKWQSEFANLKKVGMDTIVFAPALDSKKREVFYTSSIPGTKFAEGCGDVIEALLRNAKKAHFKVFLGLNEHDAWWSNTVDDREWLLAQMREGNVVADDLYKRYKKRYPATFAGWYWVWEVDNLRFNTPKKRQNLADAIETNVAYLHRLDPNMPMMLCPFMNYRVSKSAPYGEMWKDVFAKTSLGRGDIFAPQDSVGAGGLDLTRFEEWMRVLRDAVATKPGLKFWIDAETFVQDDWSSAPMKRFARQIEVDSRYAQKTVTFAYSHYYSPNNANPAWQKAYEKWVRTGELSDEAPPAPAAPLVRWTSGDQLEVAFLARQGAAGDCGYEVVSGANVVAKLQIPKEPRKPGEKVTILVDKAHSARNSVYELRAFDVYGNRSAPVPLSVP